MEIQLQNHSLMLKLGYKCKTSTIKKKHGSIDQKI
jgi:hypothetical protein